MGRHGPCADVRRVPGDDGGGSVRTPIGGCPRAGGTSGCRGDRRLRRVAGPGGCSVLRGSARRAGTFGRPCRRGRQAAVAREADRPDAHAGARAGGRGRCCWRSDPVDADPALLPADPYVSRRPRRICGFGSARFIRVRRVPRGQSVRHSLAPRARRAAGRRSPHPGPHGRGRRAHRPHRDHRGSVAVGGHHHPSRVGRDRAGLSVLGGAW